MTEMIRPGDEAKAVAEIERMFDGQTEITVFPKPEVLAALHKFVSVQAERTDAGKDVQTFRDLAGRLGALDYQEGIEFLVTNAEVDIINTAWMRSFVLGRSWPHERVAFESFNYEVIGAGGRTSEVFQEYLEEFTPGAM